MSCCWGKARCCKVRKTRRGTQLETQANLVCNEIIKLVLEYVFNPTVELYICGSAARFARPPLTSVCSLLLTEPFVIYRKVPIFCLCGNAARSKFGWNLYFSKLHAILYSVSASAPREGLISLRSDRAPIALQSETTSSVSVSCIN